MAPIIPYQDGVMKIHISIYKWVKGKSFFCNILLYIGYNAK